MKVELIKIDPRKLKLLEVNARFMSHEEFQRLVNNVSRDKALTSVPFCCEEEDGSLVVLSGNHRVQAAIEAGIEEIDVMITRDKLTKSQKIAIQLSHNSITGKDDPFILKELYEAIDDFDYKLYSGLDDKTLELIEKVSAESMSAYNLDYQVLSIAFLPKEIKKIASVMKQVKAEVGKNKALVVRMSEYDKYLDTIEMISSSKNIKNVAGSFLALLEVVENHLDELKDLWIDDAVEKQWVPIETIFGRTKITAKDGRIINKAVEKMVSKGEIKNNEKYKAILKMAEKYLEDSKKK